MVAAEQGGRWRAWAAVPLVALGGCVDAIGWLRLNELFVSFMSGTSTLLGIALAEGHGARAGALATVVALFALGALAGAALGRLAGRRWQAAAVLGLVAALLHAALLLPRPVLAMVPAMGALNTALPGVGGITFVTGAIARTCQGLVAAMAGEAPHRAWVQQAATWAAMVAGAAGGALLELGWGHQALAVPAGGALLAALLAAALAAGPERR